MQFALRAAVWERKYERRVVPGSRPYVILQTMGPVAFVFDLCDTKPINPNRDLIPETITNPFVAKGQVPPGALKRLIVALNSKHTEAQHIGTLAHELGHIFCGHLGAVKEGFWPDNSSAPKDVREFEAEAVAYLVTDRLGLDLGSHKYLAGYLSGDKLLPGYGLDTVLKAAGKIEEMLRGTFRVRRSAGSQ